MVKITQRTLASIKPTGSIQFIRDDTLKGFAIKITAKGQASYIVESRIRGGRSVRKTIGNVDHISLEEARIEARELLLKLKKGVDIAKEVQVVPPEKNSLSDVFENYLRNRLKLKPSTRVDYKNVMNNCFDNFLSRKAEHITQEDIAEKYKELIGRSSEAYANKAMRTLKAVLNSSGLVVNPVTQFLKISGVSTVSEARRRYLSADELVEILEWSKHADFMEHPGQPLYEFCQLLSVYLMTGLRKNEALHLKKSDYDRLRGTLTISNTKSGRELVIPVIGSLRGIIERRYKLSETDSFWNYSESEFRTLFDKCRQSLPIKKHFTIHDLRRTFAEHCQLIGVDLNVIASCLNHAPIGVTSKSYLGGGLARQAMITEVYEKLEEQYLGYYFGMDEIRLKPGQNWTDKV